MDLCAEMLLAALQQRHAGRLRATRFCPPFRRRLGRLPLVGSHRWSQNADRLINRFWDYPGHLRRQARTFDVFHLCDHSYAQLIHELPARRTGVLCHDLDTFRCLLEPRREPRPSWFRRMAACVLDGLRKAAVVFTVSERTRREIERYHLVDPARLVLAPNGVAPEFIPDLESNGVPESRPYLLHVGSCIPRKRIDVLLDVFAGVRGRFPDLRLIQVGGAWTGEQREQIERLGLGDAVSQQRGLDRREIATLYRGAALVLQPSEAEGFGLPVLEALACGAVVVASDLPVLREVGGDAVIYCPVADVPAWVETVGRVLNDPTAAPPRTVRLARAQRYSWAAQAEVMVDAYERLLGTA
jgi:glycosyltransferase involved in cell wall biosynthesis